MSYKKTTLSFTEDELLGLLMTLDWGLMDYEDEEFVEEVSETAVRLERGLCRLRGEKWDKTKSPFSANIPRYQD